MRAIVSTGKSKRVVELPTWVELHGLSSSAVPAVSCARCGKRTELVGTKQDAERELGRFVLWHRKCVDPALIRAAVDAARTRDVPEPGQFIVWKRKR